MKIENNEIMRIMLCSRLVVLNEEEIKLISSSVYPLMERCKFEVCICLYRILNLSDKSFYDEYAVRFVDACLSLSVSGINLTDVKKEFITQINSINGEILSNVLREIIAKG